MKRGAIFSAIFHVALALLIFFGLPIFNRPDEVIDQPIVLEMVPIAEKSNPRPNPTPATRPTPEPPKPVEAKPTPPTPAPTPPPPQVAKAEPTPPAPKPPEPKPEPKPEVKPDPVPAPVPKPEVKKPDPPKETPKQVATATPPKKPDPPKKPEPPKDDPIASILKNLAPAKPQPTQPTNTLPKQQQAAAQPFAPPSLDQQVTRSETDAARDQIMPCWNAPVGARDAGDLIVQIRAEMAQDGTVLRASITSTSRMGDPVYRAAAESALRAVINNECHKPLKLPPEKYNQWKTLDLYFDPKDMMG
ncbi:MAG TPA: energy transducer TonB [Alphaproteobacteria bacterium]